MVGKENAIVWQCGMDRRSNQIGLFSIYTAMQNTKTSDFWYMTLKDNQFVDDTLKKVFPQVNILYVDDLIAKYKQNWTPKRAKSQANKLWENGFVNCKFFIYALPQFAKYKKILNLDNDIEVSNDLDEFLFSLDMNGKHIAMA